MFFLSSRVCGKPADCQIIFRERAGNLPGLIFCFADARERKPTARLSAASVRDAGRLSDCQLRVCGKMNGGSDYLLRVCGNKNGGSADALQVRLSIDDPLFDVSQVGLVCLGGFDGFVAGRRSVVGLLVGRAADSRDAINRVSTTMP